MTRHLFCFCLLAFATSAIADDWATESIPLFDGESLAGWEGDGFWFRVEDRAIVAGRDERPIPHNVFLCTTQAYGDFELRLQVKLVGEGDNAGIQFRSRRVTGETEVSGYQADVGRAGEKNVWGSLYDESRRNRMLVLADQDVVGSLIKPDRWNDLRIVCRGPRIRIFLNGQSTVDYTETDDAIPESGVIGLQIHSGPPAEAWYRDIRIRQF